MHLRQVGFHLVLLTGQNCGIHHDLVSAVYTQGGGVRWPQHTPHSGRGVTEAQGCRSIPTLLSMLLTSLLIQWSLNPVSEKYI